MSEYVLDNAVTMAWCFSDEATAYTENLPDRLSSLVDSAVTNVSMLAVRKGRISKEKALTFLKNLTDLPLRSRRRKADILPVLADLMERHRLTAYDAAYLELVIRKDLPLATLDTALIKAAKILDKTIV